MSNNVDRRGFITRLGLAGLASSLVLALVGTFRFFYLSIFYERSRKVKVGRPEAFPKGTARLFTEERFFFFRDDDGFYAISAVCTHLGCIVRQVENHYQCPCHGSRFDINGKVIRGPAPGPLKWFRVTQSADGYLVVNMAKSVRTGTRFAHA